MSSSCVCTGDGPLYTCVVQVTPLTAQMETQALPPDHTLEGSSHQIQECLWVSGLLGFASLQQSLCA